MKTKSILWQYVLLTLVVVLIAYPSLNADSRNHFIRHVSWQSDDRLDRSHLEIDLEDGTLVITHEDRRDYSTVEITEEYELSVDGRHIKTDKDQKKLLGEYYELVVGFEDAIIDIGKEGARIGISGAVLGLKAVGGVFKLLSPHYDSDDLERDLEREAEKIEEKAEKLERQAEQIEHMVDELDAIARELTREIPELDDLGWF